MAELLKLALDRAAAAVCNQPQDFGKKDSEDRDIGNV